MLSLPLLLPGLWWCGWPARTGPAEKVLSSSPVVNAVGFAEVVDDDGAGVAVKAVSKGALNAIGVGVVVVVVVVIAREGSAFPLYTVTAGELDGVKTDVLDAVRGAGLKVVAGMETLSSLSFPSVLDGAQA